MKHYVATLDESKAQAVAAFGESLDRARRAATGGCPRLPEMLRRS
jgi:hypothetical protein